MRIPPSSFAVLPLNRGPCHSPPKPQKALAQSEQKTTPSGLERALARLQSLLEPSAGQANAADRISANIARYAQTQASSAAPTDPSQPTDTATAPGAAVAGSATT